mgnify:FL=1|jgi:hypothetical protein|tara:strand:- start:604 stop:861 length:258 start_codon:yes stop_codon:yes gene_type:complete
MNKKNKDALLEAQNLTDKQFAALKEYYVDRIVDNMSMKDLVIYVTDDMQRWIDDMTFNDAMVEIEEYFDEYFTDTIQEVIEECDS